MDFKKLGNVLTVDRRGRAGRRLSSGGSRSTPRWCATSARATGSRPRRQRVRRIELPLQLERHRARWSRAWRPSQAETAYEPMLFWFGLARPAAGAADPLHGQAERDRLTTRRARRIESSNAQAADHRWQGHRGRGRDHADPGLRAGGRGDPALLLSRAPVDRRQLPHVPGRGAGHAEAGGLLRHGRQRSAPQQGRQPQDHQHQDADGEEGARRRDGVPAHQSPARLPDLRPGRGVRPAGPGHGLRPRRLALRGEQAGGGGEVSGAADQDGDDALHPVHALRALHDGGGGRRGARRHRPRRGHGDHHLPRARHDVGALRQRDRPVPGGRADASALGLHLPPLGAAQDRIDRRHGCGRLEHPRRRARSRGAAHPAAQQRRGERGVDLRQDALRGRRAAHPAPRSALRARERPARARDLGRGLGPGCRQAEGGEAGADRRHRRRSRRGRGDVRAARPARGSRLAQLRLPAGRRQARPAARPRELSVQYEHRGHRAGRRDPAGRHQSAPRGGGAQRAPAQALAPGRTPPSA